MVEKKETRVNMFSVIFVVVIFFNIVTDLRDTFAALAGSIIYKVGVNALHLVCLNCLHILLSSTNQYFLL